ncbi:MAG: ABC transporter ATP-binding protein [Halopseudomonas sp.]
MIQLRIDRKQYAGQTLFENFELQLQPGELLCLLGPSGCGKTTLLNLIAGIDKRFDGQLGWSAGSDPAAQAKTISYMFQQPRLLPWRTVSQNLALVIEPDQHYRIAPLLAQMGLAERADSYPNSLSLGMARRVALARCLIVEPELILMDEPFVSLDPPTAQEMRQQLQQIRQLRPQTSILFVTHDVREALTLADRILLLGGTPTQVLHRWCGPLEPSQRDAAFLAEQEPRLLDHYRLVATEGDDTNRSGQDRRSAENRAEPWRIASG